MTANSSDYLYSRGPQAASTILANGFEVADLEKLNATMFKSEYTEGVYVVEDEDQCFNDACFSYAFNTKIGGLKITSTSESETDLLKQIADSVQTL